jgi:hypothetical protein
MPHLQSPLQTLQTGGKTMELHPDLLRESLSFFPRLYHTYHLPFRLECMDAASQCKRPTSPAPPTLSDVSQISSCKTAVPQWSPLTLGLDFVLQRDHRRRRTPGPPIPSGSGQLADMPTSLPSRFVESMAPRSTASGALSVPKFATW